MSLERTYAFGIAPSAGLAWGFGLSALGPTGVALGACAGAVVGLMGGWALGRLARRAERRWLPGLAAFGFL